MKAKVNGVWTNLENVSITQFFENSLPDFTGNDGKYLKLVDGEIQWAVAGGDFSGTMDDIDDGVTYVKTENNYTDAEKAVVAATSGTNTGDQDLSGLVVKANNLSDLANAATARTNLGATTVGGNLFTLSNPSAVRWLRVNADNSITPRTAAETLSDIGAQAAGSYLTSSNIVATITNGVTTNAPSEDAVFDALALKQDTLVNGYGVSGAAATKSISLTASSAFATAETTISAATYADIAGCSVNLAAGTWLIFAHVVARAANTIIQCFGAITTDANVVVAESAVSRPASGTASLNSPVSMSWFAIVSPAAPTTYKLRGARGLTGHTGSWIAMDGNGVNTTNHATNNTDKGTSIIAVRIA